MAPAFEFGPEPSSADTSKESTDGSQATLCRAQIDWLEKEVSRSLYLLTGDEITAGRKSDCNICLRMEPTSDPDNRDKTFLISSHHFSLRRSGGLLQFVDAGSSNGSFWGSDKLEENVPVLVESEMRINIGKVLDLEFDVVRNGVGNSSAVSFVRIRRGNNSPDIEYAILFDTAPVGSGSNAILPVAVATTSSSRRVRALDVGETFTSDPARIAVRSGRLFIERTGEERVTLNGIELHRGQPVVLATGELTIGSQAFVVS
jgi:pSer/pThr/pTyr-binding forkhead associated (FHA) protein